VTERLDPLIVKRGPGRFHDGPAERSLDGGEISAIGLPCRSTRKVSPFSTSERTPDALFRNSVNVTVFTKSLLI